MGSVKYDAPTTSHGSSNYQSAQGFAARRSKPPSSTDLYYWLVAPEAQGGGGRTVYGAALWLSDWDGVTVPEGFGAWAAGGTLAP
jgi:hypothetical protein